MARLIVLAAALAGSLVATTASGATTYPTLDGETMTGVPQVESNCNLSGTSTISYSVSGAAVGAYPGTFTETGVATIAPTCCDATSLTFVALTPKASCTSATPDSRRNVRSDRPRC